jgi:ParB family chromosome partitioning protein
LCPALRHRARIYLPSPECVLYGCGRKGAVGLDAKYAGLDRYGEELAGWPAETALRARCTALEWQLPKDPARLFGGLLERPQTELISMLACCVALTVDAVQADERPSAADEIVQVAGFDMRSYWTPTAASYLSHVCRAQILKIVREAVSPEIAGALSKLTAKAALAEAAEKRLAGTGWLPKLLKAGA